jgi:hypothetical protein
MPDQVVAPILGALPPRSAAAAFAHRIGAQQVQHAVARWGERRRRLLLRARLKEPGSWREPRSLALQKLRLPSLARGPLLRAFAGRVGRLGVLSEPYFSIERKLNILLPLCYPTR